MGDEAQANQVSGSFWEKMMNILSRNPFPEPLGKRTQPRVLLFFPGGRPVGPNTPEQVPGWAGVWEGDT